MKGGGKKKEEAGQDLHPWEGAEKEERFLHPGKRPHLWGDQLGQKESFRGSEKSTINSLWQAEQRETYTDGHATTLCAPA